MVLISFLCFQFNCISTSATSGISLNLSFGFEFDSALLSELELLQEPVPNASKTTPRDRFRGQSTIHHQRPAACTPSFGGHGNSDSSLAQRFGQHTRERISTPIEDTEHVLLFSSAHSPVFSPVTSAIELHNGKFEQPNNR